MDVESIDMDYIRNIRNKARALTKQEKGGAFGINKRQAGKDPK